MAAQAKASQPGGKSGSAKGKDTPQPGRQQKRADLYAARVVPAQAPEDALKDGELDLQAFVAAHEFEIRALEQSMATSKATGMTRAFQKVPRGLRRRTANHNSKRLPKRLRSRAKKEMDEHNTPSVEARRRKPRTTRARIRLETAKRIRKLAERRKRRKMKQGHQEQEKQGDTAGEETSKGVSVVARQARPRIRRNALNEPPSAPAKFRKRQLDKTWLPTHAWQAKRARLTEPKSPLWRFAMPLTPNEKIYRPTHRAQGARGAVVWDMSYMSTIALYGNEPGMQRLMKRIGVIQESCWNKNGRRWRLGARTWSGTLSRDTQSGRRFIAPTTILWDPEIESDDSEEKKKDPRRALFRVHPSAFLELFSELVRLAKMETPQLYVEDLRFEIGSIDVTGPASTELLQSLITPYVSKSQPRTKHAELWQSLSGLTNPSSLTPNAVLGFLAQDPRLRYPPKKAENTYHAEDEMKLLELLATWPADEKIQPYPLFDRGIRHKASSLPPQSSLSRRRTKAAPGSFLKPTARDPPIPVLLLASKSGSDTQTQGTWTLLAPWKTIMPFWYSMVRCPLSTGANPRFAGLNEVRQVAFERGQPWFPADMITTDAGVAWEAEQRRVRKTAWKKRPKSKKISWERLDLGGGRRGEVGDGLACDFEHLFGLGDRKQDEPAPSSSVERVEDAMGVDTKANDDNAFEEKTEMTTPEDGRLLKLLHGISKVEFSRLASSASTTAEVPNSVLAVRVTILGRGVVGPCARVYRLPSAPKAAPVSSDAEVPATIPPEAPTGGLPPSLPHDLRSQWLSRLPSSSASKTGSKASKRPTDVAKDDLESRKKRLARELTQPATPWPPTKANATEINGHHPLVPNADDLIGFVTTGSFSLAEGRGMAIGSIAVDKVLGDVKVDASEGKLCIVRNAGENVGWLARWTAI